jgi:C-terminal processing protease CtpA/Prc
MRSFTRHTLVALTPIAVLPLAGCIVVVSESDRESMSYSSEWAAASRRPVVGITMDSVEKPMAAQLGIDAGRSALITSVTPGRPAERAGVQKYDVVTGVDGTDWASPGHLREVIRAKKDGEDLRLRVLRGGQPMDLTIRIERPPTPAAPDQ